MSLCVYHIILNYLWCHIESQGTYPGSTKYNNNPGNAVFFGLKEPFIDHAY